MNDEHDLEDVDEVQTITTTRRIRYQRSRRVRWQLGPVRARTTSFEAAGSPQPYHPHKKADLIMNLGDNQQVDITVSADDTAGNAVGPAALTVASSDETIVTITDNGNGTFTAVATGTLGSAVITAQDTETDGSQFSGSLAIDVVPEGVASINLVPGTPVEKPAPTPAP